MRIIRLAIIIGFTSFLSAQTNGFISSIKEVKQSVIPVACGTWPDQDQGGNVSIKQIMGTGFFVNAEGNFITAAHVITGHFKWYSNERPSADCFPVIEIPDPTWQKTHWFEFHGCITDTKIDVAICKTLTNPFSSPGLHARWLRLSSNITFNDGTPVAFTGFPQDIVVPITSRANIAATGEFLAIGQIDIVIDKATWHGMSGGPLYLSDGTVIGIIQQGGEGVWTDLSFARDTSAILEFLSKNHIIVASDLPEKPAKKKRK